MVHPSIHNSLKFEVSHFTSGVKVLGPYNSRMAAKVALYRIVSLINWERDYDELWLSTRVQSLARFIYPMIKDPYAIFPLTSDEECCILDALGGVSDSTELH